MPLFASKSIQYMILLYQSMMLRCLLCSISSLSMGASLKVLARHRLEVPDLVPAIHGLNIVAGHLRGIGSEAAAHFEGAAQQLRQTEHKVVADAAPIFREVTYPA
jgi:hypothetical protein